MAEMTVDGRDLMQSVTIKVRMPRALGLRIWMASKLLGLSGWVSGVSMVIEMDEENSL